jgi:hypothetical protein
MRDPNATQRNTTQGNANQCMQCRVCCNLRSEAVILEQRRQPVRPHSVFNKRAAICMHTRVGGACTSGHFSFRHGRRVCTCGRCLHKWPLQLQTWETIECALIGSIVCLSPLPRKPAHGWRQSETIVKAACVLCAVRCCCCHCEKAGNGLDHGRSSVSGASEAVVEVSSTVTQSPERV